MKTIRFDIELDATEVMLALRASEFSPKAVDLYEVDPEKDTIELEKNEWGTQLIILMDR